MELKSFAMREGMAMVSKKPHAQVFVVVGDGRSAGTIKTIPVRKEFSSPILNTQRLDTGGLEVQVAASYFKRGWRLLDDCYEAEPDLVAEIEDKNGKVHKSNRDECRASFYGFMDFWTNGPSKALKKKPTDKRYDNSIVIGFPDEMLPQYCRNLAESRNPYGAIFDPVTRTMVDKSSRVAEPEPEAEPKAKEDSKRGSSRSVA